ncbi:MAG TPA: tetratricopeptide repeat protein [Thermoanaerobaculia bacterium]|jgi:tetratricopeptide (TPR) repeat protein
MKRIVLIAAVALTAVSCTTIRDQFQRNDENPYVEAPFYAKYLNTGSNLDAQIQRKLVALEADPDNASLHNDLGTLLVQKGFPKDAAIEFERAVDADKRLYQAWYNLGTLRAINGDTEGARAALAETVDLKPGHPQALFHLGLIEEGLGNRERAVSLYAKAFRHNPAMLDVRVNPRILDTRLAHLALLELYDQSHATRSMQFQTAPQMPKDPATDAAMAAESAKTTAPTTSPAPPKKN